MSGTESSGTMGRLAEAAEAIGATSSKLAKVRILATYLASLDGARVPMAARYFAGRTFPSGDPRVLNVGGSVLSGVLRDIAGLNDQQLAALWRRHRDAGDCVHEVLSARAARMCGAADRTGAETPLTDGGECRGTVTEGGEPPGAGIDLIEVDTVFAEIAGTAAASARRSALVGTLARCTPLEGKYIVKLITGEMRIGLREGLVEEAIGAAFDREATAVARADMLVGDLGRVALLAMEDRLDKAAPQLFSPLRYMLASPVADAEEAVHRVGETAWIEDKYDGIRCQLHRGGDRIALYS
ncbi:MAG: hypothetical protein ABR564_03950, partial [Candidatus Dormibacteria bacterium]